MGASGRQERDAARTDKATRRRHVPLRTCIICGNKTSKGDLLRIVATPEGPVKVDPIGRKSGRGAYVCGDRVCFQKGISRGRLEYALRSKLADEDWKQIVSFILDNENCA